MLLLTLLSSSTANSTLSSDLQEAEVFIMDNHRCDKIYRKQSLLPYVAHLVLGSMVCATSYGENLCNVSCRCSGSSSAGNNSGVAASSGAGFL